MQVDIYNQTGEVQGNFDLPESIFNLKANPDLIHQVVQAQVANARQVIAHTKDRGERRGGGKKPWKQKGTGRARHASIRSPIWKGGGVTFGPTKDRNFEQKINKKMKRKALFMALSSKVKDHEFMLVSDLVLGQPKTKEAVQILQTLATKLEGYKKGKTKQDSILFVIPAENKDIVRAMANIPFVQTMPAKSLNIVDVLKQKYVICLKDSVSAIEQTYKI